MSLAPTATPAELERENAYLRNRNAQMAEDILALEAEVQRLGQIVERLYGRKAARAPNPLGGGQS